MYNEISGSEQSRINHNTMKYLKSLPLHASLDQDARQSGNVLFIILLGVVLFGALSFSVMRTQGTVSETAEPERLKMQATEIIRYAQDVRRAVDMMRANGLSESDIRFAHADLDVAYGTYGTNPTAEVFNPAGGGAYYKKPKKEWLDPANITTADSGAWLFTGASEVFNIGTPTDDNCSAWPVADRPKCSELVMFLPYITRELCIAINQALNLGDATTTPSKDNTSMSFTKFAGTFTYATQIRPTEVAYRGQEAYCIQGDSSPATGTYHFYQVLIAR